MATAESLAGAVRPAPCVVEVAVEAKNDNCLRAAAPSLGRRAARAKASAGEYEDVGHMAQDAREADAGLAN